MTATIQLNDTPDVTCMLCGDVTYQGSHTAVLLSPDDDGLVCSECLWSIVSADDPTEWLHERARRNEKQALAHRQRAERQGSMAEWLRRLADVGVELPSREELEAAGAIDPDTIPF